MQIDNVYRIFTKQRAWILTALQWICHLCVWLLWETQTPHTKCRELNNYNSQHTAVQQQKDLLTLFNLAQLTLLYTNPVQQETTEPVYKVHNNKCTTINKKWVSHTTQGKPQSMQTLFNNFSPSHSSPIHLQQNWFCRNELLSIEFSP